MTTRRLPLIPGLVTLLVLVIAVLAWGILRKARMDEDSLQMAVSTTEEVFSTVSGQRLAQLAHPTLLEQRPADSLNAYVVSIPRIMGTLDAIQSISGATDVSLFPFSLRPPQANYAIELVFNGNPATAIVAMIYAEEGWQFTAFRVDAEMLFN